MGQFDIREFGIQEPATASAAAVEAWDNERDRQVQLNQTNIENERAEKTLEIEERKLGREEWDMMYGNAKNASQRVMVYKSGLNSGVSGLTPSGLSAVEDEALTEFTNKEMLNNYYSASDAGKVELFPKLRSSLINSGNSSDRTIMTQLQKDYETRKGDIENKEVIQMISNQYGDVFSPQLSSFFKRTGDISDTQLNMAVEMMKQNLASKQKTRKERYDLAQSLIGMQTKGEFPSPEQINTVSKANMLGYKLLQSLEGEPDPDTETLPYPFESGLTEGLDKELTGVDDTFDDLSADEKSKQFLKTLDNMGISKESWGEMDIEEQKLKGQEVIDSINKKTYGKVVKKAGFGEIEYADPKGATVVTDEMIDMNMEAFMDKKRIPKSQRNNPKIIEQVREMVRKGLKKELEKESRKRTLGIAEESLPEYQRFYSGRKGRDI